MHYLVIGYGLIELKYTFDQIFNKFLLSGSKIFISKKIVWIYANVDIILRNCIASDEFGFCLV